MKISYVLPILLPCTLQSCSQPQNEADTLSRNRNVSHLHLEADLFLDFHNAYRNTTNTVCRIPFMNARYDEVVAELQQNASNAELAIELALALDDATSRVGDHTMWNTWFTQLAANPNSATSILDDVGAELVESYTLGKFNEAVFRPEFRAIVGRIAKARGIADDFDDFIKISITKIGLTKYLGNKTHNLITRTGIASSFSRAHHGAARLLERFAGTGVAKGLGTLQNLALAYEHSPANA